MKQTIIKAFLCLVVALSGLTANAQVKAFEKYADMKDVTYVYISKFMLGMVGKQATPQVPGVNVKNLANKLTGIQIIHADSKSAQTKLKNDVKALMAKDKYDLLMQMNEEDNKVNIYHNIHKQQSVVSMLVDGKDGVTVMVFSGKFTIDDVMKMTQ